jgi:YjbE family integral membrane protein
MPVGALAGRWAVPFLGSWVAFPTDPEFWGRWAGIVLIDLVLAGDNALVIAMAVRMLPARSQAIGAICGSIGAILLRVVFTLGAAPLLGLSIVQLAAGLLLLWIALRLVRPQAGDARRVRQGGTVLDAIWIITLADVVMSLDNVLAVAAAARGSAALIIFGIALSLPLVVWGSSVLARLMNRYLWIIWLGGGILGYVAGEMMLRDPLLERWLDASAVEILRYPVPLALGLVVMFVGWRLAPPSYRTLGMP